MSSNLDGTFPATAIHKNVRRATSEGDGGPRGRFPPRPSLAKASLRRRFSVELSTETLCQAAIDEESFYGAYGDMRKKLDYSYHVHYRKERQWLHDSIIEDLLENSDDLATDGPRDPCRGENAASAPWFILTVGPQGSGKRYTVEQLVRKNRLAFPALVVVDTEEIRRYLPEYSSYVEHSPHMVDKLTQKEAGYIAETLTWAALQQGKTVVFDSSLKDAEWYVRLIKQIRKEYECYQVAMIQVTCSEFLVIRRAKERARETGREISEDAILQPLCYIRNSIDTVKPFVDQSFVICNDESGDPYLKDASWEEFTTTFHHRIPIPRQLPRPPRVRKHLRRISFVNSSEDNHKSDDMNFYGKFAYIRKTLDYKYHRNYTFERQKFQDSIIDFFLKAAIIKDKNGEVCTTPTEPWIVFTAGAMGAGKSHTMRELVEKGRFPLLAFVNVDPDRIRNFLPEFHIYVETNPELAGELTRKEAGFIAEILTLAGLRAGKNVMVDGSLRDHSWYRRYFEQLRRDFPSLRIAILHITAPREAVFQRAAERALETGRLVPRELLEAALEQVPKSVKILAPLVDYHVELRNDSDEVEIATPGETWETFQSQWIQMCAWIPSQRLMKKISKIAESNCSSNSLAKLGTGLPESNCSSNSLASKGNGQSFNYAAS